MDIATYWNQFKTKHPEVTTDQYDAFSLGFSDDHQTNNDLAYLIRDGVKTATASAAELYEIDQEPLPKVGEYSVILDGQRQPVCVIKETQVEITPLMQVSAEHAYREGEGTRTLEQWRSDHIAFFKKEYVEANRPFNDNIPVVCETFKVIYR